MKWLIILVALLMLSYDMFSTESFSVSYFGEIINDRGDITAVYQGSKETLNISGCSIKWKKNDPFYIVKLDEEIFAIKKDTYDRFKDQYNEDDLSMKLMNERSICSISVLNTD